MAKDFAVQSYKKSSNKKKNNFLVIGLTLAAVLGLYLLKVKKPVTQTTDKSTDVVVQQETTNPRFEFYDVLSKDAEESPEKKMLSGSFMLYIGKFTYKAEAVKLQKKLAAKNHMADIKLNGEGNYIVTMGPYADDKFAKDAKQSLEQDKFRSTIKNF